MGASAYRAAPGIAAATPFNTRKALRSGLASRHPAADTEPVIAESRFVVIAAFDGPEAMARYQAWRSTNVALLKQIPQDQMRPEIGATSDGEPFARVRVSEDASERFFGYAVERCPVCQGRLGEVELALMDTSIAFPALGRTIDSTSPDRCCLQTRTCTPQGHRVARWNDEPEQPLRLIDTNSLQWLPSH